MCQISWPEMEHHWHKVIGGSKWEDCMQDFAALVYLFTDVDPVTRQCFVIEHHIVRGEIFIYLIEDKTIRYYGNI